MGHCRVPGTWERVPGTWEKVPGRRENCLFLSVCLVPCAEVCCRQASLERLPTAKSPETYTKMPSCTARYSTRTMMAILHHKKQPNNRFSRPAGSEKRWLGYFLWHKRARTIMAILSHKKEPHSYFSNPGGLENKCEAVILWHKTAIIVFV